MEILYCSRCGRVIPPGGVDEGKYYQIGDDQVCPKCYHKMPDEEHTGGTLLKAPPVERRFRPPTSKLMPAARQSAKRSSTRLPAIPAPRSSVRLYVAGLVMAILIGGIIFLMVSSHAPRQDRPVAPGRPPLIETPRNPNPAPPAAAGGSGTILREVWRGIPGSLVRDLTDSPKFSDEPSAVAYPQSFEAPAQCGSNYGTRMRGYLHAPATGGYVFWIAGDDNCELWLSSDEQPAGKTRIARVPGFTQSRQWSKFPEQQSSPRALVAGGKYYIEALHKQSTGDDCLAVGWKLPDGTVEQPIPGSRLSPFALVGAPRPGGGPPVADSTQPAITAHPASAVVSVGQQATFNVTAAGAVPLIFQWRRNGAAIPDAAGPFYTTAPTALQDNGAKFSVVVSNRAGQVASREAVLTVCPEPFSVWFDDALPEGAVPSDKDEPWIWATESPAPRSGTKTHQSPAAAGAHQHCFTGATARLSLDAGDRLFAWVYLDPANPPEQVVLQWSTGDKEWKHRAWWGADKISKVWSSFTGTGPAYHRAGDLPAAGQWARLEVPARDVGLEGLTVYGMAFTLLGGKAAWDCAGKITPPGGGAPPMGTTVPGPAPAGAALARGLIAHWKLDEGSGMKVADSADGRHDAALVHGYKWAEGKFGKALQFDGKNGQMLADGLAVNAAPGGLNTVAFWMKWTGGQQQMPFSWEEAYDLFFGPDSFGINSGEAGNVIGVASAGLAGRWVHVAAVFVNGVPGTGNCKLYLDGAAQTLANRIGSASQARTATPKVSISGWARDGKYGFSGTIDEVRIYNRELSAEEIALLAKGEPAGGTASAPSAGTAQAPAEIIVDEKDANALKTGKWVVSKMPGGWAGESIYSEETSARLRWTPDLPAAGNYEVYARWTVSGNRSNAVPYRVTHASGTATVSVDQSAAALGGKWHLLGTYAFNAGRGGCVEVSGEKGEACADAVRFVKR